MRQWKFKVKVITKMAMFFLILYIHTYAFFASHSLPYVRYCVSFSFVPLSLSPLSSVTLFHCSLSPLAEIDVRDVSLLPHTHANSEIEISFTFHASVWIGWFNVALCAPFAHPSPSLPHSPSAVTFLPQRLLLSRTLPSTALLLLMIMNIFNLKVSTHRCTHTPSSNLAFESH